MENQYVEPQYIKLTEQSEEVVIVGDAVDGTFTFWTASAQGPLTPSRMWVDISRPGVSAVDALEALTEAIEEQGWKVSDR